MRRLPPGRHPPRWGGVSSLAAQQAERTDVRRYPLAEGGQHVQTDPDVHTWWSHTLTRRSGTIFRPGGGRIKAKNQFLSRNMIHWFLPQPLKLCWLLMENKGELIATTFTPVRHQSRMQFLTSAPNFSGLILPCPGLPDPLTLTVLCEQHC